MHNFSAPYTWAPLLCCLRMSVHAKDIYLPSMCKPSLLLLMKWCSYQNCRNIHLNLLLKLTRREISVGVIWIKMYFPVNRTEMHFYSMMKGNRKTFKVVLAAWPSRAPWFNSSNKNCIKFSGGVCLVQLGGQQHPPGDLHIYKTPAVSYHVCKMVIFIYVHILCA